MNKNRTLQIIALLVILNGALQLIELIWMGT